MNKQRGELIALASATNAGSRMTLQVLRAGEFVDMHGSDLSVTDDDLDEYAANSNAWLGREEIAVEIGHTDHNGTPAAGWYKKFFTKVIDGVKWLCAEVELTTVGAEAISQNLYKYFSAEIYLKTKEVFGGGFVNHPAITGQQVLGSLALSAYLHPKERRMKFSLNGAGTALRRLWNEVIKLEMSQEETSRKLWEALRDKYGDPLDEYGMSTPWVVETYDTYVIVEKGGDKFKIDYSIDGDAVVLGDAVPVEVEYVTKSDEAGAGSTALGRPQPQGGDTTMTREQEIEAARKEEREKAELAAREQQNAVQLARQEERALVLAEQARKEAVRKLAAELTAGPHAFPQTPEQIEEILLGIPDEARAKIVPLLEGVKQSGLVDLGEHGHARDTAGKKDLDTFTARQLSAWTGAGKTVSEFFVVNPELGKADEYDLRAFEAKA